jgi:hypothetical protein
MIYKQKDRQYNGQKKKNKRTHNDLQTEGQTIQWPKEKEHTMLYKQKEMIKFAFSLKNLYLKFYFILTNLAPFDNIIICQKLKLLYSRI